MEAIHICIPEPVQFVLSRLTSYGYEAFIVGGCVRDAIINRVPKDWDVCTSALPEQVMEIFKDKHVEPTGVKFGTVTVFQGGEGIEVTTYRSDGHYSDSRHPEAISYTCSLFEDLSRRDFTINAMAYSPERGLIDPFHGTIDISKHLIRCVGNPEKRFEEDALRILRGLRFSSRLHYSIEGQTSEAMRHQAHNIANVSAERIQKEFVGLLVGEFGPRILSEYVELLYPIIPELKACVGFEQNNPYHVYDVWQHTVEALWETPQDAIIRLAVFFHDIGKPRCYMEDEKGIGHFHGHGKISAQITKDVMTRLRFPGHTINTVCQLVSEHDRFIEPTSKSVRKLLASLGAEQFERLLQVRHADIMAQNPDSATARLDKLTTLREIAGQIQVNKDCLGLKDLAVDGSDLLAIGIPEGPEIGKTLRVLLEAVLDDPCLNNRGKLLQIAAASCQ